MPKIAQSGKADKVRVWDGSDVANVDSKRKGIVTIEVPHDATHDGIMFEASYIFTQVASAANADILVMAGANKELHAVFHIVSGGQALIYLYESPTITAAGTALAINDMNRVTRNTSDARAYQGPTIGAVGTGLSQSMVEGGTTGSKVGGQVRWGSEWILKKSTNYLVRATNNTAQAQNMSIQMEFYEV